MFDIKERPKQVERALLIGVYKDAEQKEESESLLAELDSLVETLEIPVIDRLLVQGSGSGIPGTSSALERQKRSPNDAKKLAIDVIIFDNGLSPAQQRNWEALTGVAVIDREEVILDIFARRARTKEARLQVDLARMEYSLPRLTRAWGHLSRQGGGLGGKGEGETQLETDRRLVRAQIDRVEERSRTGSPSSGDSA